LHEVPIAARIPLPAGRAFAKSRALVAHNRRPAAGDLAAASRRQQRAGGNAGDDGFGRAATADALPVTGIHVAGTCSVAVWSAFQGNAVIAQLLLDAGARVDGAGRDGKTPLMFAALFDRREVAELVLARGGDPHRCEAGGRSALDLAKAMGARRAAELLVR
jgi:hypothetical protein